MKFVLILVLLVILYLYYNSTKEGFTQFAPINWQALSKNRCNDLKDQMKEINTTLQSCDVSDNYGSRDSINNKVACIDATNRQIFNTRESASWCASAEGKSAETLVEKTQQKPIVENNEFDGFSKIKSYALI